MTPSRVGPDGPRPAPVGGAPPGLALPQFGCGRCRAPVVLGATRELRVWRDGRGRLRSRSTPVAGEEGFDDLCVACRLAQVAPDALPRHRTAADQLLALREQLGVPPAAFFQRMIVAEQPLRRGWEAFRVELFGVRIRGLTPEHPVPAMVAEAASGDEPIEFALYLRRASVAGVPAAVQARWHPERGDGPLEVPGWERLRVADLNRLVGAAQLLRAYGAKVGRPPGRTTWTREEFLSRHAEERTAFYEAHGRMPTDGELAYRIGVSPATLGRYKKRWLNDRNN